MSIDLTSLVGQAMDTIFSTLPKEVRTFNFHHKLLNQPYNPATGSYPEDVVSGVKVIRTQFEYREMNASIVAVRDAKFVCKNFGVLPKEGDYFAPTVLNYVDDEYWDVVRLFEHPNLFVIHVRRR